MSHILKLSRNAYILIMAVVGIGVGFTEAILPDPNLPLDQTIRSALEIALPQVGTALAAYLTAESQE